MSHSAKGQSHHLGLHSKMNYLSDFSLTSLFSSTYLCFNSIFFSQLMQFTPLWLIFMQHICSSIIIDIIINLQPSRRVSYWQTSETEVTEQCYTHALLGPQASKWRIMLIILWETYNKIFGSIELYLQNERFEAQKTTAFDMLVVSTTVWLRKIV